MFVSLLWLSIAPKLETDTEGKVESGKLCGRESKTQLEVILLSYALDFLPVLHASALAA